MVFRKNGKQIVSPLVQISTNTHWPKYNSDEKHNHHCHKKTKPENIKKKHGENIEIIDVTSKTDEPWVHFSSFWSHGNIPVPFSDGVVATCVEGIWQALKVFESENVDESKLNVTNMKGLKRTVRRLGNVRGHRKGLKGKELLPYKEALPMFGD